MGEEWSLFHHARLKTRPSVAQLALSAAQLEEARAREHEGDSGGGRRGRGGRGDRGGRCRRGGENGGGSAQMQIQWRQLSMTEPTFASQLTREMEWAGATAGADAVAAMFCVQFAFGSEETASKLLEQARHALLCAAAWSTLFPTDSRLPLTRSNPARR